MNSYQETPIPFDNVQNASSKKPYRQPVLEMYGDLRDLTMGVSMGVGDSLSPATKKP